MLETHVRAAPDQPPRACPHDIKPKLDGDAPALHIPRILPRHRERLHQQQRGLRTASLGAPFPVRHRDAVDLGTVQLRAEFPNPDLSILPGQFVRAQVVNIEDLIELRSFHAAREKALLRTEGKEYVVKDGDVINFMHTG